MAKMVEYLNPYSHAIQISSQDKKIMRIKPNEKVILPEWYMSYCPKYLRVVRVMGEGTQAINPKKIETKSYDLREKFKKSAELRNKRKLNRNKNSKLPIENQISAEQREKEKKEQLERKRLKSERRIENSRKLAERRTKIRKQVVGRRSIESSEKLFSLACQNNKYLISNNVGIGILSYNRLDPLKRLINSIRKHTDLRRIVVFVSDDASDDDVKQWLSSQTDIVPLLNDKRLGVAGNSNRLLKCLSRFKYSILLNDDVEILDSGWTEFYKQASINTGIQHFCYHQYGVYGAKRDGLLRNINNTKIETITEKPHGAVMFYTNELFNKIGYFDERFGLYGMEHVDWSTRAGNCGMYMPGFHDIIGSEQYFKIHKEKSAVENKSKDLAESRAIFENLKDQPRQFVDHSDNIKVPSISVIVPIRNYGRQGSLEAVINTMRGQLFPNIEIIISEQDQKTNIDLGLLGPYRYYLASNKYPDQPFTKSMAFNLGVSKALYDGIILQDADIIVPSNYCNKIHSLLSKYDGVHIGSKVLYLTQDSSNNVIQNGIILESSACERAVDYFEGGSLACTKRGYCKIGGFNEMFEGYGVEDCDFFTRLKNFTIFHNTRTEDFVHLWHGRSEGWELCHRKNKRIMDQILKSSTPASYIVSLAEKLKQLYPSLS